MAVRDRLPFESIGQFVASHENFQGLSRAHQLQFYALYKAAHSRAPSYSFPRRLYLYATSRPEYTKWLAWWVAADTYTGVEAEDRYYELAREIRAFPDDSILHVMKSSSTRGKGTSLLVPEESHATITNDMDGLIDACTDKDTDFILSYLTKGGDVNVKNEEGTSLLHFAVDANSLAIVDILLLHHVNVNVEDNEGLTPLDSAKLNGEDYTNMVDLLRNGRPSTT